ncbi:hypothetical protein GCM10028791_36460 [Echinicola sediminis]
MSFKYIFSDKNNSSDGDILFNGNMNNFMKNRLAVVLFLGLFSCESNKGQSPEYHPRAIELNNKALKLSMDLKVDSALILYDQAIAIDSTYFLPHSNKMGIYLKKKAYEKALYEGEMVINKKPDSGEGWFLSGLLNEHLGNKEKAREYYEKSIDIFTDRINNAEKEKEINDSKLNRALSKIFIGDQSYIEDFKELGKIEAYAELVQEFEGKSKEELMNILLK